MVFGQQALVAGDRLGRVPELLSENVRRSEMNGSETALLQDNANLKKVERGGEEIQGSNFIVFSA